MPPKHTAVTRPWHDKVVTWAPLEVRHRAPRGTMYSELAPEVLLAIARADEARAAERDANFQWEEAARDRRHARFARHWASYIAQEGL
jgi:hypothetical protein